MPVAKPTGMRSTASLPTSHRQVLAEALRAPSAHNAQAWRLAPAGDGSVYELHYDHRDYLPFDPDDRDAYLGLGAFYETLSLAAQRHDLEASFEPRFRREGSDLLVGLVSLSPRSGGPTDPLAAALPCRRTNRAFYRRRQPMPETLRSQLDTLGCTFVEPGAVMRLMIRASVLSWADRRFVGDLRTWLRLDDDRAPDGMSPSCLGLTAVDRAALRVAFRRGRIPAALALVYASRDIRLTRSCTALAVLGSRSMEPADLFDAGRRMLRVWVSVCAAGWACHPMSIVIDRPETAPALGRIAAVSHPVAILRIGYTDRDFPAANRKSLADLLRQTAGGAVGAPPGSSTGPRPPLH